MTHEEQLDYTRKEAKRIADARKPYEAQIAKWKAAHKDNPELAERAIKVIEDEIELKLNLT